MGKKKKKHIPLPVLSKGALLVDSHCHLDMEPFSNDLPDVLQRARDGGIGAIITIGIDLKSSREAVHLAEKYPYIYATVGVHPHNCDSLGNNIYRELQDLSQHPKVVAYGEIGMDAVRTCFPMEQQLQHFREQVRFVKELSLPLIIHDREAHDHILNVLQEEGPFPSGGVMHCFSGNLAYAEKIINLGFHISIPGIVTFPNADTLREVATNIALEKIILETDGPYLAPVPMRGKRNEPVYTLYTAQKIAELRGLSINEVARQTTENCKKLFGINVEG